MAARKTASKARKKAGRRASKARTAIERFENEVLTADLREFSRRMRRGLAKVEKEIDTARRDARKRWVRMLRDVSHQLGGMEAAGETRWRQRTNKARRDAVKVLQRLEKAIEPKKAAKKKAAKKKVAKKKAVKRKTTRKTSTRRRVA